MEIEQLIVLLLEANIIGALMLFSFYEKKISKKKTTESVGKVDFEFRKKNREICLFFFGRKRAPNRTTPAARRKRRRRRVSSPACRRNGPASCRAPRPEPPWPTVRFSFVLFFYRTRTRKRERERAIKRERSISGRDCHRRPWINVIAAGSEKPSKKTQSNPVRGSGKRI